jgi:hypothetical protein
MSTAPATSTPNNRRREMHDVEAPAMFQFTTQHHVLGGTLIDISIVVVKGKETTQYMIESEDGHRFTFLATWDLLRKIRPAHVGHFLWIIYEGEDSSVETQGSPLKKFRVQVSREKEPSL